MAATNRFQTRVIVPDQVTLNDNEIRLNSLLQQTQTCLHTLNGLQENEREQNPLREMELEKWSSKMLEKVDQLYQSCLNDLNQSYNQLKAFQQLMSQILNNGNETNLDGNRLLALEHEICLLRCLTYQLDTSKVRIEGNVKLRSSENECESPIDDDHCYNDQKYSNEEAHQIDFPYRILVHKDTISKIQALPIFQEFVKMTGEINETTPERVLTIHGTQQLDVIENLLSHLYSSAVNQCEIRILLHQSYAPVILGKLGVRAKDLREKYSLHTLTIHPTCAPRSTERVLLIQSQSSDKIISCLREIFDYIHQHIQNEDKIILYNEINYDASLAPEYGGFVSAEMLVRMTSEQHHDRNYEHEDNDDDNYNDNTTRLYSALDAWNGSVGIDTDREFPTIKLNEDCVVKEFWINHGQFGALLGPHGVRIAQIRSQCRTVRIHTVAGSSIDTCSVKVIGPRPDVTHAVNLIMQSIKEHDRKFPFKHHRFSGRLR